MAASNMAALLMKGCALFDNLFSLVYPSPMLIPLAVADSEAPLDWEYISLVSGNAEQLNL